MKARTMFPVLAIVMAAVLVPSQSSHADRKLETLIAVVHPSNNETHLSNSDLKNIYLGRQRTWSNGAKVEAFMRPPRSNAGFAFLRRVLKMTPQRFRYHWQGRQLSGRGTIPQTLASLRLVAARVAQDRGAVAYVTKSEARKLYDRVRANRLKLIEIK